MKISSNFLNYNTLALPHQYIFSCSINFPWCFPIVAWFRTNPLSILTSLHCKLLPQSHQVQTCIGHLWYFFDYMAYLCTKLNIMARNVIYLEWKTGFEFFGSPASLYDKYADEELGINIHSLNNVFCQLRKEWKPLQYILQKRKLCQAFLFNYLICN